MNDNELDTRVREAFDSLVVPPTLQAKTLESIKALGSSHESADNADNADHVDHTVHTDNENGVYCSHHNYPEHDQITPKEKQSGHLLRLRFLGAAAACLIIIVALFGIVHVNNTPTAFVDIDINPSIELKLNCFDRVVAVEGVNADGKAAISDLSLTGLSFKDALEALASSDALKPYLNNDNFIALSVSSDDQAQEQKLIGQGEACLERLPMRGTCNAVSLAFQEEAHAQGMGCGRYAAALELTSLDDSISLEECAHLSMRELRDRINHCHASQNGDEDDTASSLGYGHGHGYGSGNGNGNGFGAGTNADSSDSGSGQGGSGQGGMHHGRH